MVIDQGMHQHQHMHQHQRKHHQPRSTIESIQPAKRTVDVEQLAVSVDFPVAPLTDVLRTRPTDVIQEQQQCAERS